ALEYLRVALQGEHLVETCSGGREAVEKLREAAHDLVFLDLSMPDLDGFEVLETVQHLHRPPPVVVLTARDTAGSALRAIKLGAADYLVKPATCETLQAAARRCGAPAPSLEATDYGLVGDCRSLRNIRALLPLLAASPETVLIVGATGTGKDLVARALHDN